ncbi:MAG: tripartite tricarboxylate transporter permease [Nanoarchaeota archaeon]|nr:tripartite tricarboxylate transporter permease [Nanoarchaeota archaeon]
MFIEIVLALLLGIFCGIITGITPGIHINLVAVMLVSISPFLLQYFPVIALGVFIISLSVTHTFLDIIPSIFLGAPSSETALGVLPGHRFLMKGQGMLAVRLSVIGAFFATIVSIAAFPLLLPFVKFFYPYVESVMGYLLFGVVIFMISRDRKRTWAIFVFLMSGFFGLLVFSLPIKDPLFPMLSGMFGIATLIVSYFGENNLPVQKDDKEIKLNKKKCAQAVCGGSIGGFFTAIMPGLGGSSAAVISLQLFRKLGDDGFMILMGAIGTVNFVLSLVALSALDKARNGGIIAIQQLMENITMNHIIVFLIASLIACCIAVFLTLNIAKVFSKLISVVNYKKLIISVIIFVCLLVIILTGPIGFLILIISTAIGLIPAIVKVTRTHSMGCLLLPVLIYFLL